MKAISRRLWRGSCHNIPVRSYLRGPPVPTNLRRWFEIQGEFGECMVTPSSQSRESMAKPCRICVVGSANVDLTFRTPRLPRPGETLAGHSLHVGMGGKGANQAVAAARLGAKVTFVARVGSDHFGAEAIQRYQA